MRRIVLLAVALVATACSGSAAEVGGSAPPTRPADPGGTTTAEPGAPAAPTSSPGSRAAVLEALDGFVRSTVTVNDPPRPDHPDLAAYRTGEVLARAVASVQQNQRLGLGYRLADEAPYAHEATIAHLDEGAAVARNCVVDGAQLVSQADGRVLNDAVVTKLFETTLVAVDGRWKVADNVVLERWEGVAGCAASS